MGRHLAVVLVFALLVWAGMVGSQNRRASEYRSHARYQSEEEAVRKGERLGLGQATMEGPADVQANGLASFVFRFTIGRAGMNTGGGIRLATAHGMFTDWGGHRLQTKNPDGEDYLAYSTSTGASLEWTGVPVASKQLFALYHPWQLINQYKLTGPALKPGDSIEIRMSRVRMQRWDETAFVFKFYVDALGDDDYLPLRENPSVRIVAAEPAELLVTASSDWEEGKPNWVNVWASDAYGNPAATYRGTIVLETDGREYTFRPEDRGVHRFDDVQFAGPGTHTIQVREKNGKLRAESNPFVVRPRTPGERVFWGDLHTHTMYSDGRGSPEETYDFGKRVAALDFAAVSDHSFIVTDQMWREIKEVTNRYNQPGRFVTFLAYEWSGMTDVGGDHNVYTADPDMPIIRCYSYFNYENLRMYRGPDKGANHVEELFRMLSARFRNENILVIPHFGGRQGNPAWHNPQLQRQIEIFSDHRRSEDWATKFLQNGYRVGIMASTDNHSGNAGYGVRAREVVRGEEGEVFSRVSPAEKATALVAVYAKELTRDAVFQALYHRRTYATTGSRILLDFDVDGSPMGSELQLGKPPRIAATAEGTAEIRLFRLVKNGRVIHSVAPGSRSANLEYVDASGDYNRKFYYVDLVQVDGEKAISSPVWVN